MKAIALNWNVFDEETNKANQSILHRKVCKQYRKVSGDNQARPGRFLAPARLWPLCAKGLADFTIRRQTRRRCMNCKADLRIRVRPAEVIQLGEVGIVRAPHIEQLLMAAFRPDYPREDCPACKGKNCVWRHTFLLDDDPPATLTVLPAEAHRDIPGATNDRIVFDFDSAQGPKTATYRWAGSICRAEDREMDPATGKVTVGAHFKAYMADHGAADDLPGVSGGGYMRVYDGQMLHGAIIGGVGPALPEYKVDAFWAAGTDMLFYERLKVEPIPEPPRAPEKEAKAKGASKGKTVEAPVGAQPAPGKNGKRKRSTPEPGEPRKKAAKRYIVLD